MINDMSTNLKVMADEIYKQTEALILEQLNELISRGLLVIEKGPMSLTTYDSHFSNVGDPHKIKVSQTVKLKLKDQEYIERLEKENVDLRAILRSIKNCDLSER